MRGASFHNRRQRLRECARGKMLVVLIGQPKGSLEFQRLAPQP
jgi:hypothetical protein